MQLNRTFHSPNETVYEKNKKKKEEKVMMLIALQKKNKKKRNIFKQKHFNVEFNPILMHKKPKTEIK